MRTPMCTHHCVDGDQVVPDVDFNMLGWPYLVGVVAVPLLVAPQQQLVQVVILPCQVVAVGGSLAVQNWNSKKLKKHNAK